jgi:hypothetical protein
MKHDDGGAIRLLEFGDDCRRFILRVNRVVYVHDVMRPLLSNDIEECGEILHGDS